jgi:hypothetical protein
MRDFGCANANLGSPRTSLRGSFLNAAVSPHQSISTTPALFVTISAPAPANGSSSRWDAVALYDPTSHALTGLQGNQINGVVLFLLVSNNILLVGGNFTLGTKPDFTVYDLSRPEVANCTTKLKGVFY